MFNITYADGRRIQIEAANREAARDKAYRLDRSQAVSRVEPA